LGTDIALLIGKMQRQRQTQTQDTGVCVLAARERRVERVACGVCVHLQQGRTQTVEHCQLWTGVCVCVCVCVCYYVCVCVCVCVCMVLREENS
jgi:hypothetical protein